METAFDDSPPEPPPPSATSNRGVEVQEAPNDDGQADVRTSTPTGAQLFHGERPPSGGDSIRTPRSLEEVNPEGSGSNPAAVAGSREQLAHAIPDSSHALPQRPPAATFALADIVADDPVAIPATTADPAASISQQHAASDRSSSEASDDGGSAVHPGLTFPPDRGSNSQDEAGGASEVTPGHEPDARCQDEALSTVTSAAPHGTADDEDDAGHVDDDVNDDPQDVPRVHARHAEKATVRRFRARQLGGSRHLAGDFTDPAAGTMDGDVGQSSSEGDVDGDEDFRERATHVRPRAPRRSRRRNDDDDDDGLPNGETETSRAEVQHDDPPKETAGGAFVREEYSPNSAEGQQRDDDVRIADQQPGSGTTTSPMDHATAAAGDRPVVDDGTTVGVADDESVATNHHDPPHAASSSSEALRRDDGSDSSAAAATAEDEPRGDGVAALAVPPPPSEADIAAMIAEAVASRLEEALREERLRMLGDREHLQKRLAELEAHERRFARSVTIMAAAAVKKQKKDFVDATRSKMALSRAKLAACVLRCRTQLTQLRTVAQQQARLASGLVEDGLNASTAEAEARITSLTEQLRESRQAHSLLESKAARWAVELQQVAAIRGALHYFPTNDAVGLPPPASAPPPVVRLFLSIVGCGRIVTMAPLHLSVIAFKIVVLHRAIRQNLVTVDEDAEGRSSPQQRLVRLAHHYQLLLDGVVLFDEDVLEDVGVTPASELSMMLWSPSVPELPAAKSHHAASPPPLPPASHSGRPAASSDPTSHARPSTAPPPTMVPPTAAAHRPATTGPPQVAPSAGFPTAGPEARRASWCRDDDLLIYVVTNTARRDEIESYESLDRRLMAETARMELGPIHSQEAKDRRAVYKRLSDNLRSRLLDRSTFGTSDEHRAAARVTLERLDNALNGIRAPGSTIQVSDEELIRAALAQGEAALKATPANIDESERIAARRAQADSLRRRRERLIDDLKDMIDTVRLKLRIPEELWNRAETLLSRAHTCVVLADSMSVDEMQEAWTNMNSLIAAVQDKRRTTTA